MSLIKVYNLSSSNTFTNISVEIKVSTKASLYNISLFQRRTKTITRKLKRFNTIYLCYIINGGYTVIHSVYLPGTELYVFC